MEEIKEQLAIYKRLYYQKPNKDDAYMQKKRESAQRHIQKKKISEYEAMHNIKISPDLIARGLVIRIAHQKKHGRKINHHNV